ncbi:hypothetical protein BDZ91DRAFT_779380 [Kalaharituber pfeilii]|nr:hypothetical protein BDZ91DRAFT_779380 [Kalaharituber pfeilii]
MAPNGGELNDTVGLPIEMKDFVGMVKGLICGGYGEWQKVDPAWVGKPLHEYRIRERKRLPPGRSTPAKGKLLNNNVREWRVTARASRHVLGKARQENPIDDPLKYLYKLLSPRVGARVPALNPGSSASEREPTDALCRPALRVGASSQSGNLIENFCLSIKKHNENVDRNWIQKEEADARRAWGCDDM